MLPNYTVNTNSHEQHVQIFNRKRLYTVYYTLYVQVEILSVHTEEMRHAATTYYSLVRDLVHNVHSWNVLTL
jgi:hypothetical protein